MKRAQIDVQAPPSPRKPPRIPDGPSMMGIQCGHCGHEANIEDFEKSPMGLDIPEGHYQCPACGKAWTIKQQPGSMHQSRSDLPPVPIPGKRTICPVDPWL